MKSSDIAKRLGQISSTTILTISYAVTVLMSIVYLVAAFSPYVPPTRFITPALLGLFFPIALGVQCAIFVYWVLWRRWRTVLVLLGVFVISWGSVSSYFPINGSLRSSDEELPKGLRVLSYNVCGFGFIHHKGQAPNPILQYIKASRADIVCLQEAALAHDAAWGVSLDQLRSYFAKEYPYIHAMAAQPTGSMLILLSRYPIRSSKRIDIVSSTNGGMRYELLVDGKIVQLYNLHLESFRLDRAQGKAYVDMLREGNASGLKDALTAKMSPTFRAHNIQANLIHELILRHGSEYAIVCGDFNDTPISYAHGKIGEGLSDAFIEAGNGFGFSYTSGVFIVRIDHILAGSAFTPIEATVDHSIRASDHYPISAYLKWNEQDEAQQ